MILKYSFYLFFFLIPFSSFSQELIKSIRTIDPDSINFSDLSFLEKNMENVQVISLGEQSHSDGATFDAKLRLIKYLHENLGFNVIAFESGLYDCTKANLLIENRPVGNDTNYLNQAIFGVWNCKEVHNLAAYINETRKTSNPLILSGFDCQFAGNLSRNFLIEDFNQFVRFIEKESKQNLNLDTTQLNQSIRLLMKYSNYFKKLSPVDTSNIYKATTKLINIIDEIGLNNEYVSYWKQLFNSMKIDYRRKYGNMAIRDSMMAENAKWLINEKFRDKKIILWGANTHISNSTTSVDNKYLSARKYMGSYLKNTLGDKYFSLAFTSYSGDVTGRWLLDLLIMGKSKKKSIESFLHKAGDEYIFINIRDQNKKDNRYFFNSKLFGHTPRNMNLYDVIDGIFYIQKMYPATYNY